MIASTVAGSISDGVPPPKKIEPSRRSGQQRRFMSQVGQQRFSPLVLVDRGADMAVEVAIWAFADAKWPMDVKRQRLRRSSAVHFGLDSKAGHDAPRSYGPCPRDCQPRPLAAPQTGVLPWTDKSPQPRMMHSSSIDDDRRP